MSKHGNGKGFDIVGEHVVASLEGGARLTCPEERQAAARACAEIHIPALAGAPDQVDDIPLDDGRYIDLAYSFDGIQQFLYLDDRLQGRNRMANLLLT